MDDAALFQAWCDGDRKAGAALFDRHYAPIARFFQNKVGSAASADLIQSTFLACTESKERFSGHSSFRTYLFAIAHNLLKKHFRSQRRSPDAVSLSTTCARDYAPSTTSLVRARQEHRLLLEALRAIPIECQEAVELHYWEQLRTAEIAEIAGVPQGTIKSRLQRGRRLLEAELERLELTPDLLESTVTRLEDWARELRERVDLPPNPKS